MFRINLTLKNYLILSSVQFLAYIINRLTLLIFQYLFIQCLIHITIDLAYPTSSSICDSAPKHDTASAVLHSHLHMFRLQLFIIPDLCPHTSIRVTIIDLRFIRPYNSLPIIYRPIAVSLTPSKPLSGMGLGKFWLSGFLDCTKTTPTTSSPDSIDTHHSPYFRLK